MDLERIAEAVRTLVQRERVRFAVFARTESQALEVGALVLAVEHYRRNGFTVRASNLQGGRFRLKLSARGHPTTFSWYEVEKEGRRYEIHANLGVQSATRHDDGVYVVDVGVVRAGQMPASRKDLKKWSGVRNGDLISFIEAKKLVIYPMLLAQFVGIVHEIKPACLGGRTRFRSGGHFFPALVSIGYLKGTSRAIVDGYRTRKFRVNVLPTFDHAIVGMAAAVFRESPFLPRPRRATRA